MMGFKLLEFTRKGTKKVWDAKSLNVWSGESRLFPELNFLLTTHEDKSISLVIVSVYSPVNASDRDQVILSETGEEL